MAYSENKLESWNTCNTKSYWVVELGLEISMWNSVEEYLYSI